MTPEVFESMINHSGESSMELREEELSRIGNYVKRHLPEWLADVGLPQGYLQERQIRVEEELSHQRELIKQGFDLMEKRFEQVDKRFEQMEKRFEQVDKRFEQMEKRFEQVDKRFEQVDKRFEELREDMNYRFEQVDKRFESFDRRFNRITVMITTGFAMVTVLITVLKFIVP